MRQVAERRHKEILEALAEVARAIGEAKEAVSEVVNIIEMTDFYPKKSHTEEEDYQIS